MNNNKCYVKKSNIPNVKNGLFAACDIKAESIIAEFKGKLEPPNINTKNTSNRSNILFDDGYILRCPENDLPSFANDCVNFTQDRRKLLKAFRSNKPFYRLHNNVTNNAYIKNNLKLHRAFLVATHDIKKDEEICTHYGFNYWFVKELTEKGFLPEDEIDYQNYDDNYAIYPGFQSYIKLFYPDVQYITTCTIEGKQYVDVILPDNQHYQMPLIPVKDKFIKIPINLEILENCMPQSQS